jgi:hypothetical protein
VDTETRTPLALVLEILTEVSADLDLPPITAKTVLGELGLESISLVYLIAEVQQELDLGDGLLSALRARPEVGVRALTVDEFAVLAASAMLTRDASADGAW